eukprot:gene3734-7417_t
MPSKRISPEVDRPESLFSVSDNKDKSGHEFDRDRDTSTVISSRSLRSLTSTTSQLKPDGHLKDRIKGLENAIDQQIERNAMVDESLNAMGFETEKLEENLKLLVKETSDKLEAQIRQMKQEVDHRFELQDAENKRLQQHIASLKAENNQLQRKMVVVEERVKMLEKEMGGGLEISRPSTGSTEKPQPVI